MSKHKYKIRSIQNLLTDVSKNKKRLTKPNHTIVTEEEEWGEEIFYLDLSFINNIENQELELSGVIYSG